MLLINLIFEFCVVIVQAGCTPRAWLPQNPISHPSIPPPPSIPFLPHPNTHLLEVVAHVIGKSLEAIPGQTQTFHPVDTPQPWYLEIQQPQTVPVHITLLLVHVCLQQQLLTYLHVLVTTSNLDRPQPSIPFHSTLLSAHRRNQRH